LLACADSLPFRHWTGRIADPIALDQYGVKVSALAHSIGKLTSLPSLAMVSRKIIAFMAQ
jgi:hypothetical protein